MVVFIYKYMEFVSLQMIQEFLKSGLFYEKFNVLQQLLQLKIGLPMEGNSCQNGKNKGKRPRVLIPAVVA